MKKTLSLLALSLVCSGGLAAQTQGKDPKASDVRTRDIYVSVVDDKGEAAKGLTAKDFTVREGGQAREVLRAGPAQKPLDITLLVDDSQAATTAIPYIRDGISKFIDRMSGKAAIGIVTIGERPTSVAQRSEDPSVAKKGIGRIFARPGSGAYLLEGISEVARGFQKAESERPVIIAITTEGVEFSNLQHEQVLKDLHASGAVLHVLALGTPSGDMSDEMRQRNLVLAEGTVQTGGRREQLLTPMAITQALNKIADELLNQYVVTYGRPDMLIPPDKIEVRVTTAGLTARARTRLITK